MTKTYSQHIMAVTRGTPKKWANESPETAIDRNKVEHPVWTLPAPFCGMQYINNERYLPGDCPSKNEQLMAVRPNNVEFYEMRSPDRPSGFSVPLPSCNTGDEKNRIR